MKMFEKYSSQSSLFAQLLKTNVNILNLFVHRPNSTAMAQTHSKGGAKLLRIRYSMCASHASVLAPSQSDDDVVAYKYKTIAHSCYAWSMLLSSGSWTRTVCKLTKTCNSTEPSNYDLQNFGRRRGVLHLNLPSLAWYFVDHHSCCLFSVYCWSLSFGNARKI